MLQAVYGIGGIEVGQGAVRGAKIDAEGARALIPTGTTPALLIDP